MSGNPTADGHKLAMRLTDEGGVMATVICPFDGNPPHTAPCSFADVAGEPVHGCFVVENFGAVGLECFKGSVDLPTIDISWWDDGDYTEPEIWIQPALGGDVGDVD